MEVVVTVDGIVANIVEVNILGRASNLSETGLLDQRGNHVRIYCTGLGRQKRHLSRIRQFPHDQTQPIRVTAIVGPPSFRAQSHKRGSLDLRLDQVERESAAFSPTGGRAEAVNFSRHASTNSNPSPAIARVGEIGGILSLAN